MTTYNKPTGCFSQLPGSHLMV